MERIITPKRIISSRDYEHGFVPSLEFEAARKFNEEPTFDPETKPYKFVNKVKTNTRSHGWHFEIDHEYFIALQHRIYNTSECVSIYKTDSKQTFDAYTMTPLAVFVSAVDIETVVDEWAAKYILENEINNKN